MMAALFQALMILANETAIQSAPQEINSFNNYLLEVGVEMNETRCYGSYGCYDLNPPWTSDSRPVSLYPEHLEKVQPEYLIYNRRHWYEPKYLDINEPQMAQAADLDMDLPLFIVIHGFTEDGNKSWITNMKDELLIREDSNVLVVDWGKASSPPYPQAVANIRLAGVITADIVEQITHRDNKNKKVLENVHCIGHSLGAHLCGYIGYSLQNRFHVTLGRITGMDPAEPHFGKNLPPVRLDKSAAKYVDIIHTDASGFTNAGFGIIERIGHVDFYPNGGARQPGCTHSVFDYISIEKSIFNGVKKFLGCNHIRSYEFFTESINPKVPAIGITCLSYIDFLDGKCFNCKTKGTYCLTFGFDSYKSYKTLINNRLLHPNKNLILYMLTGDAPPFCKGHYKITVDISDSEESKLHKGEVGSLWLTAHSTSDGTGSKSNKMQLDTAGYHEPGSSRTYIVPGDIIDKMKSVELVFEYDTNPMNPLTWRISSPKLYVSRVYVQALETTKEITVCPKDNKPFINSMAQLMLSSYCS